MQLLGTVEYRSGNYEMARQHLREGLQRQQAWGQTREVGYTLLHLGEVENATADYEAARQHAEEARRIFVQLNHEDGLAEGLFVLGRSAQGQNDLATARTYYLDALKLCKQHHLEANALEGLELWAAYLLAVAEKEEAASLLAFIAAQSSASHAARAKAQAHLQALATVLDPQQIAAAHEKARTMTLAAVLDNVLAPPETDQITGQASL